MVNGPLPGLIAAATPRAATGWKTRRETLRGPPEHIQFPVFAAFAQILGKLHFFKLSENLRRILFDYEENRPGTANAPFKCAC